MFTSQTSSLSTSQKTPLSNLSRIPSANAEQFYLPNLRITLSMSKMRKSATTKRDTFFTKTSSKPKKVFKCTTKPTFLDSEDQLKSISGDPRPILSNKMTPWLNKTFCNSSIFKDNKTEISTQ